jgi:hypothetical protein
MCDVIPVNCSGRTGSSSGLVRAILAKKGSDIHPLVTPGVELGFIAPGLKPINSGFNRFRGNRRILIKK